MDNLGINMSTRSHILITDGEESLLFYRHSDGYPTGQETLLKFMSLIKEGIIRNNVSQSAGWLIVLGHKEYKKYNSYLDWKVGAYEPCDFYMSDIEYFYICDIKNLRIEVYGANMWQSKLGKEGLRNIKNIQKCISKRWLKLLSIITEFDDIKVLESIRT